jgi:hypothetical protein
MAAKGEQRGANWCGSRKSSAGKRWRGRLQVLLACSRAREKVSFVYSYFVLIRLKSRSFIASVSWTEIETIAFTVFTP